MLISCVHVTRIPCSKKHSTFTLTFVQEFPFALKGYIFHAPLFRTSKYFNASRLCLNYEQSRISASQDKFKIQTLLDAKSAEALLPNGIFITGSKGGL